MVPRVFLYNIQEENNIKSYDRIFTGKYLRLQHDTNVETNAAIRYVP